jgi:hypothetical protein
LRHCTTGTERGIGLQPSDDAPARDLVPDDAEQAALADIVAMREAGRTLMGIRDIMRERGGFAISHQATANILSRQGDGVAA